jgi:hypothetical protein
MPTALARVFDPFDVIRRSLRQMRNYNLPFGKPIWEEDVIMNHIDEDVYMERKRRWVDIMDVEEALKATNPGFTSFYTEEPYILRYDKCIQKYDDIMAHAPLVVQ